MTAILQALAPYQVVLTLMLLAAMICVVFIVIYSIYVNPYEDVAHMPNTGPGDPTEQADADYRGWKPRSGR